MKEVKKINKNNLIKKIFIKLCRILGYEIIDQSAFYVPTQKKSLNENLSIPGKKSITIPMGEIKISRKVTAISVIFRSCSGVNMLTQNKKRLFDKNKSEYTLRSFTSLILALNHAKEFFPKVDFNIVVVDHISEKKILNKMKNLLDKFNFKNSVISLNLSEFTSEINKTNAENKQVTDNQMSNMSSIHKSLLISKDQCKDLIYFVEDDYIHQKETIKEMIFTYERISSIINKELILCPIDYPYLYSKLDSTNIFLGSSRHWRVVEETLCTFLTSKKMITDYWGKYTSMCKFEHYPFELPLHEIYKKEYCLSPIPSLAIHCTNINSVYGISPNVNWKKIWDESESPED